MTTNVEWAANPDRSKGMSLNIVTGCSKVSAGCKNCYAERMARRLKAMGQIPYQNVVDENGWTGEIGFLAERLDIPAKWIKPRTVFLNSMSDTFHEGLKDYMINRMLFMILYNPTHRFIVPTKRVKRMRHFVNEFCHVFNDDKPLPNLWCLASVEDQKTADERIPDLLATNSVVRGLSMEPLFEHVNITEIRHPDGRNFLPLVGTSGPEAFIHWVIVGFESGPGARVPDNAEEIARDIQSQCKMAGVPFFMKQMGGHPNKRHNIEDIPEVLRVREYPSV